MAISAHHLAEADRAVRAAEAARERLVVAALQEGELAPQQVIAESGVPWWVAYRMLSGVELAGPEHIGAAIKAVRLAAGLSTASLARKVNWAETTICNVERGRRRPSVELVSEIDRVLGAGGLLLRQFRGLSDESENWHRLVRALCTLAVAVSRDR